MTADEIAEKIGLKEYGKTSFLQLCEKGCDPEVLANHIVFLIAKSDFQVRGNKIHIRPFDSTEAALEGIRVQDLEPLKNAIWKIIEKINKLNRTRIVMYMDDEEYDTDIYRLPRLLAYYANEFIPLILSKTGGVGAKQRPDFTKFLTLTINHVEESTGDPNYALICDVLNELGLDYNEGSLKQKHWRGKRKMSHKEDKE